MAANSEVSLYSRQTLSLLSIVCVAVFIGIPVWWKTTEVYRSPLPYGEIEKLRHQRVPPIVSCSINVVSLINDMFHKFLAPNITITTSERSEIIIVSNIKYSKPDSLQKTKLLNLIKNDPNNNELVSGLSFTGTYTVYIAPGESLINLNTSIWYSNDRHVIVEYNTEEQLKTSISSVVNMLCGQDRISQLLSNEDKLSAVSERAAVSSGYNINLLLVSSGSSVLNWNIENTTNTLLLPFLQDETISRLANYTISSQVLYYTNIKLKTTYNKATNTYTVPSSQLPTMISNVEAYLGLGVSQWPGLNFVLYIPKETPLFISDKKNVNMDSFIIPQWGGVVFYNKVNNKDPNEVKTEHVMPVIIQQIKQLLGIKERRDICHSSISYCLFKWDSDHLLIVQTIERLSLAKQSLVSLVQLLDNVKNMVINDHIQYEVVESLRQIDKCVKDIQLDNWNSAHRAAELALHHAEVAFFDPSILALLYFPDDQKYAIYIPLFLPIGLPVVLSLVNLFKSWKKTRKEKQT